jgi:hypothetical protein
MDSVGLAIMRGRSSRRGMLCDGSYREAFVHQAAGFERAMESMLQQVSEQFMAGSRE